jgi:hypothetical protein
MNKKHALLISFGAVVGFVFGIVVERIPLVELDRKVGLDGLASLVLQMVIAVGIGYYATFKLSRDEYEREILVEEAKGVLREVKKLDISDSGDVCLSGRVADHQDVLSYLDKLGSDVYLDLDITTSAGNSIDDSGEELRSLFISFKQAASSDSLFSGFSRDDQDKLLDHKKEMTEYIISMIFESSP